MKKKLFVVMGIVLVAVICAFCLFSTGSEIIGGPDNPITIYISSNIKGDKLFWLYEKGGINVIWGDVLEKKDTHGGFHADGSSLYTYQYTDSSMEPEMEESKLWKKLPFSENVSNLINNEFDECASAIPEIANGYYFFYDRHSETKDPYDESELWNRHSINCTVAIYDADEDILYVFEEDT